MTGDYPGDYQGRDYSNAFLRSYANELTAQQQMVGNPFPRFQLQQPQPYVREGFFWRINEQVKYVEGGIVSSPVDRLRIKVARWLDKN